MLLFSATFEESVWNFAKRIVPDPNIIKLKREEETLDTIKQYYVLCNSREEKFQALCNIYGAITIAQAIIFCHVSRVLFLCVLSFNTEPQIKKKKMALSSLQSRQERLQAGLLVSCPEKTTRWQYSAGRCRWSRELL